MSRCPACGHEGALKVSEEVTADGNLKLKTVGYVFGCPRCRTAYVVEKGGTFTLNDRVKVSPEAEKERQKMRVAHDGDLAWDR